MISNTIMGAESVVTDTIRQLRRKRNISRERQVHCESSNNQEQYIELLCSYQYSGSLLAILNFGYINKRCFGMSTALPHVRRSEITCYPLTTCTLARGICRMEEIQTIKDQIT